MTKDVKNFVELYNRRSDWDTELIDLLDRKYVMSNKYLKGIILDYLHEGKITPENCDLKNAKVYSYNPSDNFRHMVCLELQAYSYDRYHETYFWVYPDDTEESYKEYKLNYIKDVFREKKDALEDKLKGCRNKLDQLDTELILLENLKKK